MSPRSFFAILGLAAFTAISAGCGGSGASVDPSAEADENEADFGDELKTKTDAAVQAEIKAAAVGTDYMSESDYPFMLVHASLPDGTRTITQEIVRDKLAWYVDHDEDADKPMRSLKAMSSTWSKWKARYDEPCEADDEYCAPNKKLMEVLGRNLRGIKVMYFGSQGSPGNVDGVGVSIFIVGRTPKGNLAGVRTIAIWT